MRRNPIKNKDGSALLIAIAIMAVLMMLSLALLLVSFSLHSTAGKQQESAQSRELAQSLSLELKYEITLPPDTAITGGEGKYPLWYYLKENVWQDSWPYLENEKRGHTWEYAYRYFKINFDNYLEETPRELIDGTSVLMYWEPSNQVDIDNIGENADKDETLLTVSVTCGSEKSKCTITTQYELVVDSVNSEKWQWYISE